jgi:hypothetical protein
MNALELIEFIQNGGTPNINPWTFQQQYTGPMGVNPTSTQKSLPAKRTTGGCSPRVNPSNVDIRYIKKNDDEG